MRSGQCHADDGTARPTTVKDQNAVNGGQNAFTPGALPAKHGVQQAQHKGKDDIDQNKHPVLFASRAAAKSQIIFKTFKYQSIFASIMVQSLVFKVIKLRIAANEMLVNICGIY